MTLLARASLGLAAFGSLLALSARADAQSNDLHDFHTQPSNSRFETAQDMAVELRFGPYLPNIDDEFESAGLTPFEDSFGDNLRWLIGFEVDWQPLRLPKFGSLGVGFGWGLTTMEGTGELDDGTTSQQPTHLTIMPMHVVGVVRIDALAETTPIPLVAYGKLGLGYALWWTNDGVSVERARVNGRRGEDTSFGYVWALGGMFRLDWLSQRSSRNLDTTHGVNHSYLFIEWFNSDLDGFGSGDMQVGVNTWMAGIAIEM